MKQLEMIPLTGLGRIRFGQTPAEIRKEMKAEAEVFEDWMGDNLNFALTYSGLLFGFDEFGRKGPSKTARLQEIHAFHRPGIRLFEKPLESWTRASLIDELTTQRLAWSSRPQLDVTIESIGVEVGFEDELACFVAIWEPSMVEQGVAVSRPWWQVW